MKKYYSYEPVREINAGTTTQVDGALMLSSKTQYQLAKVLERVSDGIEKVLKPRDVVEVKTTYLDGDYQELDTNENVVDTVFTKYYEAKGVSKLDPADQYDEKIGYVLASGRAQLKTLNKALKDIYFLLEALEAAYGEVRNMKREVTNRLKDTRFKIIETLGEKEELPEDIAQSKD